MKMRYGIQAFRLAGGLSWLENLRAFPGHPRASEASRPIRPGRHFMRLAVCSLWLAAAGNVCADFDMQHWTTANGASIYYVHRPALPMLDLQLHFDAGSARDGAAHGLAHLTAAMSARGAGGLSADTIAARFDSVGAQYGVQTGRDFSQFSLRTLTADKYLQPALETFITVLSKPDFPEDEFERLRKRALTAIQRRGQEPGTLAGIAFYQALYGEHPYAHPVQGDEESMRAITLDELRAFHRRYLVAGNLALVIVGAVSRAQAETLAARITATLAAGAKPPPLPAPQSPAPTVVRIPFASEQAHIYIGQHGLRFGDDDYFPLYLGNHILGGSGFGSRLMEEVRVKRGYAYSIWSYFYPQREPGPFIIGFQTRADQTDDAVALVQQTLQEFHGQGPSDAELALAKDNVRGGFPLKISNNSQAAQWAGRIAFYGLAPDFLDTYVSNVERVDREAVIAAFRLRVDPGKLVTVIVGGK